jgi:hypothetical protein
MHNYAYQYPEYLSMIIYYVYTYMLCDIYIYTYMYSILVKYHVFVD